MEKTSDSILKKVDSYILFFPKNVIVSLLIIGIIGFTLRILFFHPEIPMNSDNLLYLRHTGDLVIGNYHSELNHVFNDGWSWFLYPFFSIFSSNNFMEYMGLQRFISIIISVLTIIPIFFLAKKFVNKSYPVMASAIFVFEPRIAQNSLFGVTEPLYIITITISLLLFLNKKYYLQYISFIILAFAITIRSEAMFLLIPFFIMYFVQNRINKKSLIRIFVIICTITIILLPIGMIRDDQVGNDGMVGRISDGVYHANQNDEGMITFFSKGLINLGKFLGWSQIPFLLFFVPLGIFLILKNMNFFEKTIIFAGIMIILPTIYAYSVASDSRYLLPAYPILSIISVYSIRYYCEKIKKRKLFLIIIFSLILFSSFIYLDLKDVNVQHELESYNFAIEVSERALAVNTYPPESSYLEVVGLTKTESFPSFSDDYTRKNVKNFSYEKFSSIEELLKQGQKDGLTHLIIDNNPMRPNFYSEIFENEEKYSFLIKEFDSIENNYEYHAKIFKIDYERLGEANE